MILIYGKGKVGNGLANFLEATNQSYKITDDTELKIDKNKHTLNTEQKQFLNQFDQIIISPGVPPYHPVYKNCPEKTISELNFLGDFIDKNGLRDQLIIIGISGTNGKSTTTHIAYNLLKQIFEKDKSTDIHLSGNFGTPLSKTLTDIITQNNKNNKHILVTECSSFMLYKLQNFSFDYSILTNIETDHLDRHPDKNDYAQAKTNLIKHTNKVSFTTEKVYQKLDSELQSKTTIFGYNYDLNGTQFVGHHNQANIQSVYLLTQELLHNISKPPFFLHSAGRGKGEVKGDLIKSYIKNIKPLEHRMQLYTTINGVDIYDDAICTSAHAQENALKGLTKPVVLICGGYDKGDNFDYLGDLYKDKVAYGVFIGLTAPKFEKIFTEQEINFSTQKTLHDATTTAFNYAQKNKLDIVFSPACASFDMFKNVYDRIDQFEAEIKLLEKL